MTIAYICEDCARAIGGVWPEGHVATIHTGICDVCKKELRLAHVFDWQLDRQGKPKKMTEATWD